MQSVEILITVRNSSKKEEQKSMHYSGKSVLLDISEWSLVVRQQFLDAGTKFYLYYHSACTPSGLTSLVCP